MNSLTIQAPAKLNFYLEVLGKREDNYHQIQSIVQTIDLYDTLHFKVKRSPGIEVVCKHPDMPTNKDNLVYRAALMFLRLAHLRLGLEIILEKRIPISAGLGGGSTDAAATLLALNHLSRADIPFSTLLHHGSKLGADVPFCLVGGTALIAGKGDFVYPLPALQRGWFVLVFPRISVSSSWAYQQLQYHKSGRPMHTRLRLSTLKNTIQRHQISAMRDLMFNRLEEVVVDRFPLIRAVQNELMRNGARKTLMSGSGSTVFALLNSRKEAQILAEQMQSSGEVYIARPTAGKNDKED